MFEKDNTVFKTYGNGKLMAVKLWSMVDDKGERVTKFKFEFREFNKAAQQGSKTTGDVDVYMDLDDFTYFCKLLESGRIYGFLSNSGNKAAYEHFGGTEESKSLQITNGNKGMLIVAQRGPGRKTKTGATLPDYNSWNDQNSKKIMLALSDESAVQLGSAGLRAINIFDMWTAFGRADQNLERLNPKRESQDERYQNAQPRQQAPQQRGYVASGGYDQGYGQEGYGQQAGYAAQGGYQPQGNYVW